jgi:hypothetical protein
MTVLLHSRLASPAGSPRKPLRWNVELLSGQITAIGFRISYVGGGTTSKWAMRYENNHSPQCRQVVGEESPPGCSNGRVSTREK